MRSMTGYGRADIQDDRASWLIEIHGVNRRFLEVNVNIPRELLAFEPEIRKWVRKEIHRGCVTLYINVLWHQGAPVEIQPNMPYIHSLASSWAKVAQAVGQSKQSCDVSFLLQQAEALQCDYSQADLDAYRDILFEGCRKGLQAFVDAKEKEGEALAEELRDRLSFVSEEMKRVEEQAEGQVSLYQEKLQGRFAELVTVPSDQEERLLRELTLYADRVDTSEERSRFAIHRNRFFHLLEEKKAPLGKNLDFLVQEMNREINTIGSKAVGTETAQSVVAIKTELEKIREQLQNIE